VKVNVLFHILECNLSSYFQWHINGCAKSKIVVKHQSFQIVM